MSSAALKKKIAKFSEIAEGLRNGQSFNITRLTTLKSLCKDSTAAGQFALFLSNLTLLHMQQRETPTHLDDETWQQYLELLRKAIPPMEEYLNNPTQDNKKHLWDVYSELNNSQNEYKNVKWNSVRIVHSTEVLLAEYAIKCILAPQESSYWGYYIGKEYAEKYEPGYWEGLVPSSASRVEDIGNFWHQYYFGPNN